MPRPRIIYAAFDKTIEEKEENKDIVLNASARQVAVLC
jgi:hypothetical protein